MKVLIVDDHSLLRTGIIALLKEDSPDTIVIEATDGEHALALAGQHPDLDAVLLDLQMPGLEGHSVLQEFGRRHPGLPVVILTSTEDPEEVRRAIANGALGYVPKSASPKTLLGALKLVMQGDVYVPPLMLGTLSNSAGERPQDRNETLPRLTERQTEVLKLIQRGLSNKMIARELGVAEKTVKVHVTSLLKALNVVNRTQAISVARDLLRDRDE